MQSIVSWAKRTHRPTGGAAVGPNIVSALSKTAETENKEAGNNED